MFYEILKRRRSIRKFQDREIEEDQIELLLKAALLSPSSRGIRPWEFIMIDDAKTLETLAESKPHGAGFLKGAAIGIAIIAETSKSDVWVEDTSIAAAILLLMAEELGMGACWCQIRNRKYDEKSSASDFVRKTLQIPDKYEVEAIIGIGYPDERKRPYVDQDLLYDKVHQGIFGRLRYEA